jgi:hypothetical protein
MNNLCETEHRARSMRGKLRFRPMRADRGFGAVARLSAHEF